MFGKNSKFSGKGKTVWNRRGPAAGDYMFMSHRSQEPAHEGLFGQVKQEALFDFGMRLGEGTGAVIGMSLLEAAAKIYSEMATFKNAGVSHKGNDEGWMEELLRMAMILAERR